MRNFIRKIIFRKHKSGVIVGREVRKYADSILHEVKTAESILLHCHPSPDPDSVGSALAMKFVLEDFGKKVTVIKGDSEIPKGFLHFPGAKDIVGKNIFEINLADYDLFISLDSASLDQITKKGPIVFPDSLKVINIDHHKTNTRFGSINLVEQNYPACSQVLFELFQEWHVKMSEYIATNLYMGIYTDTVEFRTQSTTSQTLLIASILRPHISDLTNLISDMENNESKERIKFIGLMINSIETYYGDIIAVASMKNEDVLANKFTLSEVGTHAISPIMRTVAEWKVSIIMVEIEPGKVKVSTRSKNADKYDVSKLAESLGGGGHKAAAGVLMNMPLEDAKKMILLKSKEIFGL